MIKKHRFRIALLMGNLFDHYDGALYGLLAPLLAPLFFPKEDPLIGFMLTCAIIPLGMLARPLGSIIFGHIGDTKGRKRALALALSGMAITTACMGVLPTYAQVGVFAPALLSIGRIFQNFFGAGETMGGVITLLEGSENERHQRIVTGLYNASTIGGILLASLAIALNVPWRWLYIGGACTLLFARFVRRGAIDEEVASVSRHRWKDLWEHRVPFLLLTLLFGFSYATFSIAIVMTSGFIPLISSISQEAMMQWNVRLLLLDLVTLPLFAYFSAKGMRLALIGALFGPFLFLFLQSNSLILIGGVRIFLVLIGASFSASMQHLSVKLIPQAYRYSVSSLAYSVGALLLGGPTTSLSLWLYYKTGSVAAASLYWSLLAVIGLLALAKARRYAYTEGNEAKQA